MRLEPIAPGNMTPTQKILYLDMRKGIADYFSLLKAERDDGRCLAHGTLGFTSRAWEGQSGN